MPKVIFMGTPPFAVPTLQALIQSEFQVTCVFTQPPRPKGRGQKVTPSAVHQLAADHYLPVFTPRTLKDPEVLEILNTQRPHFIIVVAYGMILPRAVLEIPTAGCINVHASLLPRWRGAAPIHRAILSGDRETGITTMVMNEGLDTGDILYQEKIMILPQDTSETLHDRLAYLGAPLLIKTLKGITQNQLKPSPQPNGGITYAKKLEKSESFLDWRQSAKDLERKIRAFHPWPGTHFCFQGKSLKVLKAKECEKENSAEPGTIVELHPLSVSCGQGMLVLHTLQLEGKRPMSSYDFINGFQLQTGMKLD